MNREQAREIARRASHDWEFPQGVETRSEAEAVADALHAAYEKDRAVPAACQDSRLASIKETARRMYASGQCGEVFDIIMNQAESFEDAFERRYGGKP